MNLSKPWLKHYPDEIAPSYEYPKHNLAEILVHSAKRFPSKEALVFFDKTISYEQLLNLSYRCANALVELGIQRGDRVAIMLPNCPQAVIAFFGALMVGAIVVETNPLYMEQEIEHQLVDSGSVAIIALDLLYPRIANVKSKTQLQHVVVTALDDLIAEKKSGLESGEGIHSFVNLLEQASSDPLCVVVDAEEELALLQYTGGTTGVSKGVMLTHYNLLANTVQCFHWLGLEHGKNRMLGALPFFHVYGLTILMNLAMYCGAMLIVVPKFEAVSILQTIEKWKPMMFPGTPTMYIALLNHPERAQYDLSSIKICNSGAAPMPHEVQDQFEEATGGRVSEGYGLTEASPVTHSNLIWGYRKKGTIGLPYPDTEAKVVDPDTGEDLPVGEVGELAIRGPQVMKGYWQREEETSRTLRDGWLHTGDMVSMDEEGFFTVVDRKKDMIIAGGFKIYPRDVEEVIFKHPAIKQAVAVGIPDSYRGETVKAYLVLKEGTHVTEKEMDEWCRSQLASYKVPRIYEFRDALPVTMTGKVLRRKLLEEELEREKREQEQQEREAQ